MKNFTRVISFFLLALAARDAMAQVETPYCGSTIGMPACASIFGGAVAPGGNAAFSMHLGANFLRANANDSVKVWLHGNEAGWTGTLYYVDHRDGNRLDPLFTNKDGPTCPTAAPCAAAVNLQGPRPGYPNGHDIRIGDNIYFAYIPTPANGQSLKYTGPNIPPPPPNPYYSAQSHPNFPACRNCWSPAGRLNTRVVTFSFEDNGSAGSDFDFNDIIFRVSGLSLNTDSVQTPYAIPPGQQFTSPTLSVTLNCNTQNARIHYTLNGTDPDSNSTLYTGQPIILSANTTIKAKGYHANLLPSRIMTEVYQKVFLGNSTLQILDQNAGPVTAGYLSNANTSYNIRLTTAASLTTTNITARTAMAADNDVVTVSNPVNSGSNLQFTTSPAVPLALNLTPPAPANNRSTNAAFYDTLIVTWTNPQNPSDIPSARIPIRPAPNQATITFSRTNSQAGATTQFTGTENPIYVIVQDQVLPAGATPQVVVTVTPFIAGTGDNLTVNLVRGACIGTVCTYVGTIPTQIGGAPTPDGNLQVSINDQITGVFTDPLDGDRATASAGFGVAAQIAGTLVFTDKNGNIWPTGTNYSPAEGFLYLRYTDERGNGSLASKNVSLTLATDRGPYLAAGLPDSETVVVNLQPGADTAGTWIGQIDLKDLPNPTPGNDVAEPYVLGKFTASVATHRPDLTPDGNRATANINVAYPNRDPDIVVVDRRTDSSIIVRSTDSIVIRINDQSLSSGPDTIFVDVSCPGNNSTVQRVMLVEVSPGVYESRPLPKSEGQHQPDGVLRCLANDVIRISYTDPVYGPVPPKDFPIVDYGVTTLHYENASGTIITQISELQATEFTVVAKGPGPSVVTVDEIDVTLVINNAQGQEFDREVVRARETGANTNEFRYSISYRFLRGAATASRNGILEGHVPNINPARAMGTVTLNNRTVSAPIDLIAALVQPQNAYIRDVNGDGRADQVVIVFDNAVPQPPASVDAQWNNADSTSKTASGANVAVSGNVVTLNFSANQWSEGNTAQGSPLPLARLPDNLVFGGLTVPIDDSIGPIIVSAQKRVPPEGTNVGISAIDTLIIRVSEPIVSGGQMEQIVKVTSSCNIPYSQAQTINTYATPVLSSDGMTITILVDGSRVNIPAGSCVYLNRDPGQVTDMKGNIPPPKGKELIGNNRNLVIQGLVGYPPVAGLPSNPSDPRWVASNQGAIDPATGKPYAQGAPTPDGRVQWIPPADWPAGNGSIDGSIGSYNPQIPLDPRSQNQPFPDERNPIMPMPRDISSVLVIAMGRYIAHINIFDNLGNHVRSLKQGFGYHGEMKNDFRRTPQGQKPGWYSWLVWDQKDKKGQVAGQGVYVWKIVFDFPDQGKQEVFYTRTGIVRNGLVNAY